MGVTVITRAERVAITREESPCPFERMAENDEGDGEKAQTVDLGAVGALRDLALNRAGNAAAQARAVAANLDTATDIAHDLAPSQRRDYAWQGLSAA